jgi:uncharacterized protein YkwD
MRADAKPTSLASLTLALALLAGCNLLTGADAFELSEGGAGEGGAGDGASGPGPGPGAGAGPSTGGAAPVCGDATCSPGEDCLSCEADCGPCAATCGNDTCDADETCTNCPTDCGPCEPVCGDGTCEAAGTPPESWGAGAADCGPCTSCGDGACNGGETCESCAGDCGPCGPTCGDGTCDPGETQENCASDCGSPTGCQGSGDATTGLDAEETAFLGLINQYRADNGKGPLTACTSLNRAAQGHSEDMRDQNYFDHTGLDGSSPWGRSCDACYELGCGPSTAMAENIAAGNSGASATFNQWKNSPGHNANMLGGSFTVIGIGRATGGGQYGVYWTNVFGGASEASCN